MTKQTITLTACLLSLAGLMACGGGGGATSGVSPASTRNLVSNITSREMTNIYAGDREFFSDCRGSICEARIGSENISVEDIHDSAILETSNSGTLEVSGTPYGYRMVKRLGRQSGFYSIRVFRTDADFSFEYSTSFGRNERKPIRSATWNGDMGGHDVLSGNQLTGKAKVTYDFLDNLVDLRISNIRGLGYSGSIWTEWDNMKVNADGSFYFDTSSYPDDYVAGGFYGRNAEETAGIFENDEIAGAWFATR